MKQSKKNEETAKQYQKKTPTQHILDKPGMYIGPIDMVSEEMYVVTSENYIQKKIIQYIPGLERIFEEILLNAFDQTVREGTNTNEIRVTIDQKTDTISIYNNGNGIPVIYKEELECYIPEMLFGQLLTSSNYDDTQKRITGGTNGLGSKVSNLFSSWFKLETVDADNKKCFEMEWSHSMSEKTNPIIKTFKNKPFTRITFRPDLKRFNINGLTDDMISLMKKRVIDIGFNANKPIKVFYNEENVTIKKPEEYISLYGIPLDTCLVDSSNERWTIAVAPSEDGNTQVSFVNGINTTTGGAHVQHVTQLITKEISEKLKSKKVDLKPADIKNRLCIFVKAFIENPVFDSQTKECLKMPKSKFGSEYIMDEKFRKKLVNCSMIKDMIEYSKFKSEKNLNKVNGKKISRIFGIENLEEANWAGKAKSDQCRLIVTEGLSAKTFAMSGYSVIGRDRYGIFPLKGKLLNVRGIDNNKVTNNDELCKLVKILGLKFNEKYKDVKSLRYGGIISLVDSDSDGLHIHGLLLNFFHYFWPELLEMQYVKMCLTPIVKVNKGPSIKEFYNLNEYERWNQETKDAPRWNVKYYKGLGTSNAQEAKQALTNIERKLLHFTKDEEADASINLGFNKKLTDERKEWLSTTYDASLNMDRSTNYVPVSEFIHKELIHFSHYDNQRSIPNLLDGFKPTQRKIMFSALKYLQHGEMKVAQFGAKVAEKTDYHHGEMSIMNTIINMAQNYMGSNNIHLLEPNGGFGTRLNNNDAASPRYIHTSLSGMAKLIFLPQDNPLLKPNISDNKPVEPEWFVPCIPMILVNGSEGIGTGFSTEILKYNVEDLCDYLICKMDNKPFKKVLLPWYRGFKGTVKRTMENKYVTYGVYSMDSKNNILHITELPVGTWTDTFKKLIETKWQTEEGIIDVQNDSDDVRINFKIKCSPIYFNHIQQMTKAKLINEFHLISKLSETNMYLFDRNHQIKKYNSVIDILDEYYDVRLEFYEKRKANILRILQHEVMELYNKMRFIKYIRESKINILKISNVSLIQNLVNEKFDKIPTEDDTYKYLIDMPIRQLTDEYAKKLNAQHTEKKKEYEIYSNMCIKDMWKDDLKKIIQENQKVNTSFL